MAGTRLASSLLLRVDIDVARHLDAAVSIMDTHGVATILGAVRSARAVRCARGHDHHLLILVAGSRRRVHVGVGQFLVGGRAVVVVAGKRAVGTLGPVGRRLVAGLGEEQAATRVLAGLAIAVGIAAAQDLNDGHERGDASGDDDNVDFHSVPDEEQDSQPDEIGAAVEIAGKHGNLDDGHDECTGWGVSLYDSKKKRERDVHSTSAEKTADSELAAALHLQVPDHVERDGGKSKIHECHVSCRRENISFASQRIEGGERTADGNGIVDNNLRRPAVAGERGVPQFLRGRALREDEDDLEEVPADDQNAHGPDQDGAPAGGGLQAQNQRGYGQLARHESHDAPDLRDPVDLARLGRLLG